MSPPLTRRQLLAGVAGTLSLGVGGATVYHAYTGPVQLVIENFVRDPLTVAVRINQDSSLMHETAYEVPAFMPTDDEATSGAGRVEAQITERTVHGTVYTVNASTDRHDGLSAADDNTYRTTCTGYTDFPAPDGSQKRLTDAITLTINPASGAGIVLDGPACGSPWS